MTVLIVVGVVGFLKRSVDVLLNDRFSFILRSG